MKYFKVVPASKTSYCGIYYKEGTLKVPPAKEDCDEFLCSYTDATNIFYYIENGCYLIEMEDMEDPVYEEDVRIDPYTLERIRIPQWFTSKFKCVKMWRMDKLSTIQMLLKEGADPKVYNYILLRNSIIHHYGIYKFCSMNWSRIAKEPWNKPMEILESEGYVLRSSRDEGWESSRLWS